MRKLLLLVEDEALIQEIILSALESGGFETASAMNGGEALAVLQSQHNELAGLVTDIRLGSGLSGWDVARKARELIPTLPVVYITGDSGHEWASQGVPDSVLIGKPFPPAQLVTAVAHLMTAAETRWKS